MTRKMTVLTRPPNSLEPRPISAPFLIHLSFVIITVKLALPPHFNPNCNWCPSVTITWTSIDFNFQLPATSYVLTITIETNLNILCISSAWKMIYHSLQVPASTTSQICLQSQVTITMGDIPNYLLHHINHEICKSQVTNTWPSISCG